MRFVLPIALCAAVAGCEPTTPDPAADTDLAWRVDGLTLRSVEPASLIASAPDRVTLHLSVDGLPEGAPIALRYAGEAVPDAGPLVADGDGHTLSFTPPALPEGTTGRAAIALSVGEAEVSTGVRLRRSPDALTLASRPDALLLPRTHRPAMGWVADLDGDGTPYHLIVDLGPPSVTGALPQPTLEVARCASATCEALASIPLPEATRTSAGALHTDLLRLHAPLGEGPVAYLNLPLDCPSAEPCGEHATVTVTLDDDGEVVTSTVLLASDDYTPGDPQHLSVESDGSGDVPMLLTLTRVPLAELPSDLFMKGLPLGPRKLARTKPGDHTLIDALHPESEAMLNEADVVDFCPRIAASGRPGSPPDGVIFGVDTTNDLLYFGRLVRPNTPLQVAHLPSAEPSTSCPEPARPRCVADDFDGDGWPDAIFEVPDDAGCPVLMFSRGGADAMSAPFPLLKVGTQAGDDALTRKRPGRFASGQWSASATADGALLTLMAELPSQILLDLSGDAPDLIESLPAAPGLHRALLHGDTPVSPPHSLTDAGGRASVHAAAEHLTESTQIAARPPKRHPGPRGSYTKTTTAGPWQLTEGVLRAGDDHSEVRWSSDAATHTLTELDACPLAAATLVPTPQGARLVCTSEEGVTLTEIEASDAGLTTTSTTATFASPRPHSAAWIASTNSGSAQRALLRGPEGKLYVTGPLVADSPIDVVDVTAACGEDNTCTAFFRSSSRLDVAPIGLGGDAAFLLRRHSEEPDACGPSITAAVLRGDGTLSPISLPEGKRLTHVSKNEGLACGNTDHLRVASTNSTCDTVEIQRFDLASGRLGRKTTRTDATLDASWAGPLRQLDLDGDGCPELLNPSGDVLQNHCDCTYGRGPTLSPKAAGLSVDDAFTPVDDIVAPAQDYNSSRSNKARGIFAGDLDLGGGDEDDDSLPADEAPDFRDPDDDNDGLLTTHELAWPFFDGLTCPVERCR